jgi:hypothetical protein
LVWASAVAANADAVAAGVGVGERALCGEAGSCTVARAGESASRKGLGVVAEVRLVWAGGWAASSRWLEPGTRLGRSKRSGTRCRWGECSGGAAVQPN